MAKQLCDSKCDWACENQPCERKLHWVIFSLISSALIEVFCFREVQREAHEILQWWQRFRFVITDSLLVMIEQRRKKSLIFLRSNGWFSQARSQIMLEKQQKLFVQGYNLEVHYVIKYMQKHCATVIISRVSQVFV